MVAYNNPWHKVAVVAACSICSQNKNYQSPYGLLQSLPTPGCPWSHITLDFVTGLPVSKVNWVILAIIDRFSKAAHFILLLNPPWHWRLLNSWLDPTGFSICDIVSDRGPQFISQVWRYFCQILRPALSVTYHPWSNDRIERCNQELEAGNTCLLITGSENLWSKIKITNGTMVYN